MGNRFLAILLLIQVLPLQAHFSLFFNQKEISEFHENPHNFSNDEKLSLSGILYYDENHWTLWINNTVIRPENMTDLIGFSIEEVTVDSVTLSHTASSDKNLEIFTLHPQQSYPSSFQTPNKE